MDLDLPVPELLARRTQDLLIALWATKHEAKKSESDAEQASDHIVIDGHIVIDSTGLQLYGEGEPPTGGG